MQAQGAVAGMAAASREDRDVEAALVRRAAAGDRAAFELIYRRHVARVHALCLRLTGDPEEAAGAVQDAFVRAWHRLPGFRGDSALGTWLHRLAANVALDRLRARGRREVRHAGLEDEAVHARPELLVPAAPGGAAWDLERAVAALPAGARTVFVLHRIEGYRIDEIAEMTGVKAGTVKSQLHRARRLLREVLK